jgi:hypothetical protein
MRTKRFQFPVTVEAMVEGIVGSVDSELEMPDLPIPEDVEPYKEDLQDLELDEEAPEEKLAEQPNSIPEDLEPYKEGLEDLELDEDAPEFLPAEKPIYMVDKQDPVQLGFWMDAMGNVYSNAGNMLPQPAHPGSPPPTPIMLNDDWDEDAQGSEALTLPFHPQQQQHSYGMMSPPVSPFNSPPHGAAFMGQQMMFQPGGDFSANGMYGYSAFPQTNHHHQLFSAAEPAAPPTWEDFRGQVCDAVTSWQGGAAQVVKMYTAGRDSVRQAVLAELTGELWRLASTHGGALLLKRMVMGTRGEGAIPPSCARRQ